MRATVYLLLSLGALAFSLSAGKDLNWDALNYHLYAGFAAVHDRFGQDFFPAGAASYFNPYAHLPFYLLVASNTPAIIIGGVFAIVHSINLWLTYEIALALQPAESSRRESAAILAAVLAALNPVFLQQLGSTFADSTTSIPALAGWLLLLRFHATSATWLLAASGALLGLAAALKLSNVVFALAALPLVACMRAERGKKLRLSVLWACCLAAAFMAAAASWSWKLWQSFGNPVFPLFNAWFQSPDFIVEPLKHERFVPLTWSDAVLRPFHMMLPERMIHTEPRAADVRYAALFVLILVWPLLALRDRPAGNAMVREPAGAVLGTAAGFLVAWVLWLGMSGNSRYFLPMACVAAALAATLLARLANRRWFVYAAAALVGVQCIQVVMGTQLRWTEQDWSGAWFRVHVPERFATEPYLYLSLNVQSAAFLAPVLARESGLINVSGSYVLGDGRPGASRAEQMIAESASRLRLLLPIQRVDGEGRPLNPPVDVLNGRIARFGLSVDMSDCDYFVLDGGLDLMTLGESHPGRAKGPGKTYFLTCRVVGAGRPDPAYEAEARIASRVFDHVEDACPNLFHPRRTVAVKNGYWTRHYVLGSDLQVYIVGSTVKYMNPVAGGEAIAIGRVDDWERGPQHMDCTRRRGPTFTRTDN